MLLKLSLILHVALVLGFPKEAPEPMKTSVESLEPAQKPYFYLTQQNVNNPQAGDQQMLNEENPKASFPPQQVLQIQPNMPNGYGVQYLEPQFQYPVYNQQAFPRVQPSILVYGAGGQGQPILINPGSPPGNFLVPQQPGTNVFIRGNPQTPVFVGGYPNPKPAHIPPIEKDAEEIPTNPSNIPPLQSTDPQEKRPEKLETFTEDYKPDQPITNPSGGSDGTPRPLTRNDLRPGHRFFILNGEPLYQNYPINYPGEQQVNFQQIEQPFQQRLQDKQPQQEVNYNVPVQGFFLRQVPSNFNAVPVENPGDLNRPNPNQNGPQYTQSFVPLGPQAFQQEDFNQLNIPQEALFRLPIGQFRFAPPNNAYFPYSEDAENDSVVVNANFEDPGDLGLRGSNQEDVSLPVAKSSDASTAQATPGAVALAGPGGMAGAAPKATALAGKGGLAISSPKATAIAGTKEERKEAKDEEKEKEKKPTRKPK
ncbi:unnamed protein product [Phyllotreta striolata]|uniref:DUF4774 domain-containing protein n=1 Tax=Phyllotreta striolata TaxID=444603 RepID=A0A9N9TSR0_PHYSR|nr:unnamed protein product [Phyllotreta striolata]